MKVCRKCGSPIRDGDKFCGKCGARAPSAGSVYLEEKREKARKKKQDKEVRFQTLPSDSKTKGYRENFEEGENRFAALKWTVLVLVLMALCAAAFACLYFFMHRRAATARNSESAIEIIDQGQTAAQAESQALSDAAAGDTAADGGQNADIQIIEETAAQADAAGQAQESEAQTQAQNAAAAQGESQSETAVQSEDQGETPAAAQSEETAEALSEAQTETETETESSSPVAAEVIDVSYIESLLSSESTATASQVYLYDLKNDSEVAVGDCTQPTYASAVITVPILYCAASRIDSGELSLDTQVTYVTSIGGRGEITTEARDSLQFPLSFFLQTMTNYSDNNCINTLIDFLTLDSINSVCQSAGYTSVNLERKIVASGSQGLDNYVSSKDLAMMVKDLYTGKFTSVGTDFMDQYFKIADTDSMPTVMGTAASLSDAELFLNQNGYSDTRFNEVIVVSDGGAEYILAIMLSGSQGFTYSQAAVDITEYVNTALAGS